MRIRGNWWLLLTISVSLAVGNVWQSLQAQGIKSDLLRADDLMRRGLWTESEEIFARVLAQGSKAMTLETERQRRLCLSRLIEIHRRRGHYQEALSLALDERGELRKQPNAEMDDLLQRNALVIAECQAALASYSEARATLQDLLDHRLGRLKGFQQFQALIELAIVDHLTDHSEDAAAHWRDADRQGRKLFSQFQRSLSPDETAGLLQRLVECQEALGNDQAARQFVEVLLNPSQKSADNSSRQLRTMIELGKRATQRRDFIHAETHLKAALRQIKPDELPRLQAQIHQLLAQLLQRAGRVEEAHAEQITAVNRDRPQLSEHHD